MTAGPLRQEDFPTPVRARDRVTAPKPALVSGGSCHAYQASDGMFCRCGLQWDVNDPDPPVCPSTGTPGGK